MELLNFDSKLWYELESAYSFTDEFRENYGDIKEYVCILHEEREDIEMPVRIRRMERTQRSAYQIVFENVCENMSHQLTFYPISYIVLPYLVTLLEKKVQQKDVEWQRLIISEVGVALMGDTPRFRVKKADKEIMRNYKKALRRFRKLVKKFYKENRKWVKQMNFNDKSQIVCGTSAILGIHWLPMVLVMGFDMFSEETCDKIINVVYFLQRIHLGFVF